MIACERAPGLERRFAMEQWPCCEASWVAAVRAEAAERFHAHDGDELRITGVDIDPQALDLARRHVRQCGFERRIELINADMRDYHSPYELGALLANPPYGERLGDRRAADAVARALRMVSDAHPSLRWE